MIVHCFCINYVGDHLDELSHLLEDEGGDYTL
jgi:hypothetical protein